MNGAAKYYILMFNVIGTTTDVSSTLQRKQKLSRDKRGKPTRSKRYSVDVKAGALLTHADSVDGASNGGKVDNRHSLLLRTLNQSDYVTEAVCDFSIIKLIAYDIYNILVPIPNDADRLAVYQDEVWLEEGLKLCLGDNVSVLLHGETALGIIRFAGHVSNSLGKVFGIELLLEYVGNGNCDGACDNIQYFKTGAKSAVFCGIHKVRLRHLSETPSVANMAASAPEQIRGRRLPEIPSAPNMAAIDSERNTSQKRPKTLSNSNVHTESKKRILDSNNKNLTDSSLNRTEPNLKVDDRVVWISDLGPEYGNVKWIGVLPGSKTSEITVGLEFDNAVGSGTGRYKDQRLFSAKSNHASLVPIMGLMKADEFLGKTSAVSRTTSKKNGNYEECAYQTESESTRTSDQVKDEQKAMFTKFQHVSISNGDEQKLRSKGEISNNGSKARDYLLGKWKPMETAKQESYNLALSGGLDPLYDSSIGNHVYLPPDETGTDAVKFPLGVPDNSSPQYSMYDKSSGSSGEYDRPYEGKSVLSSRRDVYKHDPELEIGSMVEVLCRPAVFGVIRWIGSQSDQKNPEKKIAGLEMEKEIAAGTDGTFRGERFFECQSNKAFFVPLYKCRKDRRFMDKNKKSAVYENDFGDFESPDVSGQIAPPGSMDDITKICGKYKGIQGNHNSCYLDSTLFSMFYFTTCFDSIFHRPRRPTDIQQYELVQRTLKEGIVNPLRKCNYVRADKVLNLRLLLDEIGSISGMLNEEKDPEEFLSTLLQETLKVEPFIKLSSGEGSYYYQLFMEKDERLLLPTTQQLFELSFLQSDIKLAEIPSCLILQMPRCGKDYKMYERILPSLELDITDVLENAPRECVICGDIASYECKQCYREHGAGSLSLSSIAFCEGCNMTNHRHAQRMNHHPHAIKVPREYKQMREEQRLKTSENILIPREKMELFAVVCIERSHYVSFVKCGLGNSAQWLFFDSMADRKGEESGYNIPEVTLVKDLPLWLSDDNQSDILNMKDDRDFPEHKKRLVCDAYMCMYQSWDIMMFK